MRRWAGLGRCSPKPANVMHPGQQQQLEVLPPQLPLLSAFARSLVNAGYLFQFSSYVRDELRVDHQVAKVVESAHEDVHFLGVNHLLILARALLVQFHSGTLLVKVLDELSSPHEVLPRDELGHIHLVRLQGRGECAKDEAMLLGAVVGGAKPGDRLPPLMMGYGPLLAR